MHKHNTHDVYIQFQYTCVVCCLYAQFTKLHKVGHNTLYWDLLHRFWADNILTTFIIPQDDLNILNSNYFKSVNNVKYNISAFVSKWS